MQAVDREHPERAERALLVGYGRLSWMLPQPFSAKAATNLAASFWFSFMLSRWRF